MLLLSTALSALSILSGTVKGFRSINSIQKKLNKKNDNDNNHIPLEEVPLAIEDTIQNQWLQILFDFILEPDPTNSPGLSVSAPT